MIKDVGLREIEEKSETENTAKPKEADPKTGEVQSRSLQNEVNTLEAGENFGMKFVCVVSKIPGLTVDFYGLQIND